MKKSLPKSILYNNALIRVLSEFKGKELTIEYYKKTAFLGVKTIILLPIDENSTYEEMIDLFNSIKFIKNSLSKLTPKEFENIFPIQKVYDGEKWDCKDYFYTKDYLNKINEYEPIGENIDELMWEYVNREIRIFNSTCFKVVDYLRKFEGKKSMLEEWADINGIKTYSLKKDNKGKEYIYDKSNGRTISIKKKMPKYLKVIRPIS